MLLSLALLLACPSSALPLAAPQPESASYEATIQDDHKAEYEAKRKAAGKDVQKLWDLYLWCDAFGMAKEGRSCLRAILKVDPDHKEANEGLGHLEYDGKWFKNQKKLDAYKKAEEKRRAEEEGLVKWKDEWVKIDDLPYLERGMVRDENGDWVSKEETEKLAAGWVRQDLQWISPEEKPNIDKGLWKCGEDWLGLEEANAYHSSFANRWVIPGDYFVLHTTCDRDVALKAMDHMERAHRDLARILGGADHGTPPVVLLRSQDQYSKLAAGSDSTPPMEALGLSSIHYAYFADFWFDPESGEFMGAGVGFWDKDAPNGDSWGIHSARHAAALSIVESVDPSLKTLEKLRKKGNSYGDRFFEDFYKEKSIPNWFRTGAASYAERYFIDQFVGAGGNPNWAKEWSVQNLAGRGGLRPLDEVFDGELSANSPEDSAKLLNERGLVMAFIVDGKCGPVTAALGAAKAALRDKKDQKKAFKDLKVAVLKHEKELRAFAGL